ncbi:hypothetical protein ACFOU2_15835 [Bacillus songklensis]|uniref:Spore coat protein n=1 Tax=Bacillus songklensis TaxID=1069116 RepID=A0ABV8B6N9_9BACI
MHDSTPRYMINPDGTRYIPYSYGPTMGYGVPLSTGSINYHPYGVYGPYEMVYQPSQSGYGGYQHMTVPGLMGFGLQVPVSLGRF